MAKIGVIVALIGIGLMASVQLATMTKEEKKKHWWTFGLGWGLIVVGSVAQFSG